MIRRKNALFRNLFIMGLIIGFAPSSLGSYDAFGAPLPQGDRNFAGTWEGRFQGKPFVTLKLRQENGRLTGTVVHTSHLETDLDGNLLAVYVTTKEDRILEARVTGDTLLLKIADNGDETQPAECELTLTSKNAGELQMMPPPGRKLKPWKVTRTSPA